MNFISDVRDAFREGILDASTTGRKVRRWAALGVFWGLGVTCLVLSGLSIAAGSVFSGVIIGLNAVTFGLISLTVIFTSSTSELISK